MHISQIFSFGWSTSHLPLLIIVVNEYKSDLFLGFLVIESNCQRPNFFPDFPPNGQWLIICRLGFHSNLLKVCRVQLRQTTSVPFRLVRICGPSETVEQAAMMMDIRLLVNVTENIWNRIENQLGRHQGKSLTRSIGNALRIWANTIEQIGWKKQHGHHYYQHNQHQRQYHWPRHHPKFIILAIYWCGRVIKFICAEK